MAIWFDCKNVMLRRCYQFAQYYKYKSGSIITMLRDGFLRIAILGLNNKITYSVKKLPFLARKKIINVTS
jgi:hypothetical protein